MYNGFTIFSAEDEFGPIKVVENRTTRKLYFDSPVEQSCFYLKAPMTLNFEYQQKIIDLLLKFSERCSSKDSHPDFRVLMHYRGRYLLEQLIKLNTKQHTTYRIPKEIFRE